MPSEHGTPSNKKRIAPLVQWNALADVADALALVVNEGGEERDDALGQRIYELVAPYLLLAELDRHAEAVVRGDTGARATLLQRLTDLQRLLPTVRETGEGLLNQIIATNCSCQSAAPSEERFPDSVTLDPDALLRLALAARKLEPSWPGALEIVVGIAAYATAAERLANALTSGGQAGFVEAWNWLVDIAPEAFTGHSVRMLRPTVPMLRPMAAGGPGLGPGFDPGLIPSLPDDTQPPWEPPAIPGRPGSDILNQIFEKRHWVWDHKPIYKGPILDSRYLQCLLAYGAFWRNNPPPQPPVREVWADNITSIESANPCAGGTLIIHGHGFGSPKPANVDLVLAVNDVCRPFPVDTSNWSDTRIEVVLPVGVTSSAIGFCDRTYVDAYDAWARAINASLPIVAVVAGCARIAPPDAEEPWHTCPPLTSVNYAQVGSTQIKSFTVDGNTLEVADPQTFLVLAWDVSNAIDIKIERLSVTGPLPATPLSNLPKSGMRGLGYAGHTGPDRFAYRLTARGACNSVTADVVVIASQRPYLSVQGIEVTQGIQNTNNTVRLVAEKPTMVRVTVRHGLNGWGVDQVPNVYGRVQVKDASVSWANASTIDMANNSPTTPPLPNPGVSITVVAAPQRTVTNDTLNFILPTFLCRGDIDIRVEVRVDAFDQRPGEFTGYQDTVFANGPRVHFESRKALDVRFVQVNWTTDGTTSTVANCQTILRNSLPMLPTPQMVIAQHVVGVIVSAAPQGTPASQQFNPHKQDVLSQLDRLHECIEVEINESEIGSSGTYCFPDSEYLFIGVMAGNKGGLAHRPGRRAVVNDTLVTTTAHEIGHCYNQKHLFSACATLTSAVQPPFDPANTLSNNGSLIDVPFDTVNNTTITNANTLFDIMTYCGTARWVHPDRWERLFNEIGA